MKNKKYNYLMWILFFLILFAIVYFKFTLIVSPDGSYYYWYTSILNGEIPLSKWDITRGPTFPILLYISSKIFGKSSTGILIGFFLLYLVFIISSFLILRSMLKKYHKNNNIIYYILYLLFIVFNPLTLGYSHTLLTEAVAPAIIMLTTYLALRWKDVRWSSSKARYIKYLIIFSIITIFMWFLKQPYMPVILFILIISSILTAIINKSWKILFEKLLTIITIILCLVLSIIIWNKFLMSNGANTTGKGTNGYYLANGLINGQLKYYYPLIEEEYCNINYIRNSNLSEEEKDEILSLSKKDNNWCNHVKIYDFKNNENYNKQISIIYEGDSPSTIDGIKFVLNNAFQRPKYMIANYYKNYMATIDVYESILVSQKIGYYPGDHFGLWYTNENENLGLGVYYNGMVKGWWDYPGTDKSVLKREDVKYMRNQDFEGYVSHSEFTEKTFLGFSSICIMLFKILFFLALPISIYSVIKLIKNKNNDIYYMSTIIFGSSFLHILMHAVLGALIDRYAFPVYPSVLLGMILLFINTKKNKKSNKNIIKTDNKKILCAILNYNNQNLKLVEQIKNLKSVDLITDNDEASTLDIQNLKFPTNANSNIKIKTFINLANIDNYKGLLIVDSRYNLNFKNIEKVIEKFNNTNVNIIISSKSERAILNKFLNFIYSKIMNEVCGRTLKDFNYDFQIMDKEVIGYLSKIDITNTEILIEELISNYKIEEINYKLKQNKESKIKNNYVRKFEKLFYLIISDTDGRGDKE